MLLYIALCDLFQVSTHSATHTHKKRESPHITPHGNVTKFQQTVSELLCNISVDLSQEEFTNTNLNCCIRDLAEVRAPFEDSSSPVYKAGMRLVSAHLVKTPCLALQQWQEKLDTAGKQL